MAELGRVGVIFSGGGLTGAFSAGFAKAIWKTGIQPACLQGVSVGALSASKIVEGGVDDLEKTWLEIDRAGPKSVFNWRDVMFNWRSSALFFNTRVAKLIWSVDITKIVNSQTHLQIVTRNENRDWDTVVFSNQDERFRQNPEDFRRVVMASAAIPGFLPPVIMDGEQYSDGTFLCLNEIINDGCDTIFLLLNEQSDIFDRTPDHQATHWLARLSYARYQLYEEALMGRLKKDMEAHPDFYLENSSFQGEESFPSLVNKIGKYFKSLVKDLAEGEPLNLVPHRIIILSCPQPIPTLHIFGFEKGNLKMAIDYGYERASRVVEKLLKQ